MMVPQLQRQIMALARKKGWGVSPSDIIFAEKIALIHQEVSEVLEAYRKNNMHGRDGVAEELADVLARIIHLAGIYQIDLEKAFAKKMKRNRGRDWNRDQLYIDKRKR
ncbi:hypothetical protein HY624_04370 [Candidatus Uhrbacteria bacterium]|nr:hypothetical protein [Candidatus Uhrbacteria bacterium]